MKKIYNYENCRVVVHIPEDNQFKERLTKSSEDFIRKVIKERGTKNDNINSSRNFRKKEVLD